MGVEFRSKFGLNALQSPDLTFPNHDKHFSSNPNK